MPDSPQEFSEEQDTLTPPWIEAEGSTIEDPPSETAASLSEEELAVSAPYVGRWNKLVSTTNWEKGKIIAEWRTEIVEHNAELEARTDEAWSRLVGDVSPQHVGRLRRVSARFGDVYGEYQGIYWSHFLAAMEWDDAEMWLEGALREKWSIKQMQSKRFETMSSTRTSQGNASVDTISREEESPSAKREEREKSQYDDEYDAEETSGAATKEGDGSEGPSYEGPDFGEEPSKESRTPEALLGGSLAEVSASGEEEGAPPLYWQEMPKDLTESLEAVKLAIIKHKLGGWNDVSLDAVLTNLEILKRIARAS